MGETNLSGMTSVGGGNEGFSAGRSTLPAAQVGTAVTELIPGLTTHVGVQQIGSRNTGSPLTIHQTVLGESAQNVQSYISLTDMIKLSQFETGSDTNERSVPGHQSDSIQIFPADSTQAGLSWQIMQPGNMAGGTSVQQQQQAAATTRTGPVRYLRNWNNIGPKYWCRNKDADKSWSKLKIC